MKKSVRKWLMSAVLTGIMPLAVACSVADDSDNLDSVSLVANDVADKGIYEGEWTINRQVVDTARLVIDGMLRIRLPERYLLSLCLPDINNVEPLNTPATIQVYAQGYSEKSQYMAFASATTQAPGALLIFNTCSFDATVNGEFYHFSLLSKENANAIRQYGTEQWILSIPINSIVMTNQDTGLSTQKDLSATHTLYYNTKRRIR